MALINPLPPDNDPADVAHRLLIHEGSLIFNRATVYALNWISRHGAVDEAQRRLLRECRAFLLRVETSSAA